MLLGLSSPPGGDCFAGQSTATLNSGPRTAPLDQKVCSIVSWCTCSQARETLTQSQPPTTLAPDSIRWQDIKWKNGRSKVHASPSVLCAQNVSEGPNVNIATGLAQSSLLTLAPRAPRAAYRALFQNRVQPHGPPGIARCTSRVASKPPRSNAPHDHDPRRREPIQSRTYGTVLTGLGVLRPPRKLHLASFIHSRHSGSTFQNRPRVFVCAFAAAAADNSEQAKRQGKGLAKWQEEMFHFRVLMAILHDCLAPHLGGLEAFCDPLRRSLVPSRNLGQSLSPLCTSLSSFVWCLGTLIPAENGREDSNTHTHKKNQKKPTACSGQAAKRRREAVQIQYCTILP